MLAFFTGVNPRRELRTRGEDLNPAASRSATCAAPVVGVALGVETFFSFLGVAVVAFFLGVGRGTKAVGSLMSSSFRRASFFAAVLFLRRFRGRYEPLHGQKRSEKRMLNEG